jgi:hypothetical protein
MFQKRNFPCGRCAREGVEVMVKEGSRDRRKGLWDWGSQMKVDSGKLDGDDISHNVDLANSIISNSTGPPGKLIIDSGSRGTYLTVDLPVNNLHPTKNPKRIQIPDGSIMESTHEAELIYPTLRKAARHAHIVPDMHNYSLLSVGNLCNADYGVIFDRREVRIMDNQEVIMRGQRHAYTGLWHMEPHEILKMRIRNLRQRSQWITPMRPLEHQLQPP